MNILKCAYSLTVEYLNPLVTSHSKQHTVGKFTVSNLRWANKIAIEKFENALILNWTTTYVFTLPKKTSDKLQPLDGTVLQPFKKAGKEGFEKDFVQKQNYLTIKLICSSMIL